MDVLQTPVLPPSLNAAGEMDVNTTNFDEVMEVMLTWLLEAQDALSKQDPVSDCVTAVKEQFQEHEVPIINLLLHGNLKFFCFYTSVGSLTPACILAIS